MSIFDTYDKIIENIQQIPLDVYIFSKREKKLRKKIAKLQSKLNKFTKKSSSGKIIDIEKMKQIFNKLIKYRTKSQNTLNLLKNEINAIKDKTKEITQQNFIGLSIPKVKYENINRIVKLGKKKEKGRHYCICRDSAFGNMIACDNIDCKVLWFHFECVGITLPPKAVWYCQNCKKGKNKN